MTSECSDVVVIPKRFSGIRVLLIEPDQSLLVQHAYILSQNSYQVTSTTKALTGLSMIQSTGYLYDCVLVDVDTREMDMLAFIRHVFNCQPKLSIIMMVSKDADHAMRLLKEAVKIEAILCLTKPCDVSDICNIWSHVYRETIAIEKRAGILHQANNIDIRRVDPIITLNNPYRTMMNKPVYLNFSGNHQVVTDKGKQPIEDGTYKKKRKDNKLPHINWTDAAFNEAHPSDILQHTNYLQKVQGGEKVSKKSREVQMGDNLETSGQFTLFDNQGSVIQSSSLQLMRPSNKLINSAGMSYMSIDNIKARLPTLSLPHPTTSNSNSGSSGDTFRIPMGTETSPTSGLVRNSGGRNSSQGNEDIDVGRTVAPDNNLKVVGATNLLKGFDNNNFGGASGTGASEAQKPFAFNTGVRETRTPVGIANGSSGVASGSTVIHESCTLPFGININGNSGRATVPFAFGNGNNGNGSRNGFNETMKPLRFNNYKYSQDASGSGAMSEPLAQFDCFGIPIDPWPVTGMGSVDDHGFGAGETSKFSPMTKVGTGGGEETLITNESEEDLALHEFVSLELGGLSHPQDNFQENGDNLFMDFLHHPTTDHSNLGLEPSGSVGFSFPGDQGSNISTDQTVEMPDPPVNSNIAYLGGVEDDPIFSQMTQFDVERIMQLLDEVDKGDSINGQWQFSSTS